MTIEQKHFPRSFPLIMEKKSSLLKGVLAIIFCEQYFQVNVSTTKLCHLSVSFSFLWNEITSAGADNVIVGKQLRDKAEERAGSSLESPGEANLGTDHISLLKVTSFNHSET